MSQTSCPCGSKKEFTVCCQPCLSGNTKAVTPEQLMRSRYCAFATDNVDYLIATHHLSKRKSDDRIQLAQSIQQIDWLALRVLRTESELVRPNRGFVEFVAFYQERSTSFGSDSAFDGPAIERDLPRQLHEKSEFVNEQGEWFYLHGVSLAPLTLSRGGPCWCGSGKKFKQCHAKRR